MRALLLLAAVALLGTACGGGGSVLGQLGNGDGPLGSWELAASTPPVEVPDGARVTLLLEQREGVVRAGGTAACNSYGGTASVGTDGAWSLRDVAVTEMACDPPALMDAERAYLDLLATTDEWSVEGGELTLRGGRGSLTFRRVTPVAPSTLTGTAWVLDGLLDGTGPDGSVGSTTAGVRAAVLQLRDDGTFRLFTGCRDFEGEWTTQGDEVVLPSWGEAEGSRGVGTGGELTCDAEAEAQEQAVLGVLEDRFVAEVDADQLTVRNGDLGLLFRAAA